MMDLTTKIFFILLSSSLIEKSIGIANSQEFSESRPEIRNCDFFNPQRIYNTTNLLECMNDLASAVMFHSRISRSSEDSVSSGSRRVSPFYSTNYRDPQRQVSDYHRERRLPRLYSGYTGFYDPGGFKYDYPREPFSISGGMGIILLEALTSISQYDDLKCVPRILCEVATGVIPGNSEYKQDNGRGNPLINLLTALPIGESSPLVSFGKSALTGYTNRGNPNVCYREYPRCPRNNAELVHYLNNHNGGLFRFFNKVRGHGGPYQGNHNRGVNKRERAPPPGLSSSDTDRTGTGELKFDSIFASEEHPRESSKSFFPEREKLQDSEKVVFPQDPLQGEQSLNRVSKSLMGYQERINDFGNPPFFPQERKKEESNYLSSMNPRQSEGRSRTSQTAKTPKARLYFPEDVTNETMSTFTFPDGQNVRINIAFSKLFSEGYKKALRRSFMNDHGPEPVNFEGFSMINLAELFTNERTRLDLQVVHPCDMICHDSKGTPVQFSQILPHSGILSTLMAPERPVLDLTNAIPCEVICIDRRGERRQLSTFLNQVLRINYDRPSETSNAFQGFKF